MDFRDRIRLLREKKFKLSQREMAELLGIPERTYQRIEQEDKDIKTSLLLKYANLGVNIFWLLTGEGPMFFDEKQEYAYIPRIDARLGAGNVYEMVTEDVKGLYAFRRDWLAKKGSIRNLRLVNVYGDSMSPTLEDGDIVLVDLSRKEIIPGAIYAVRLGSGLLVKRLHPSLPKGKVRVISDNPAYGPMEVDLSDPDFEVVGKVLWAGRDLEK